MRSLLSLFLIALSALLSKAEAGPSSLAAKGDPFAAPRGPSARDYLAQRSLRPKGDKEQKPDAHLSEPAGHKSPALAGVLSLAVPGAGQFYNGSQMGYLFLGVEAAAWFTHFEMHDTGVEKQKQFKKFADAHWSWERYRDPTFEDCPTVGHSDGGVQDSTLVFLYETRRNDWYEDIGKLSIYTCGWDTQRNRDIYRDMRVDSNFFLRNARYATTVVFLNHLVSALQAARGASSHNARLTGSTDLHFEWSLAALDPRAQVILSRTF